MNKITGTIVPKAVCATEPQTDKEWGGVWPLQAVPSNQDVEIEQDEQASLEYSRYVPPQESYYPLRLRQGNIVTSGHTLAADHLSAADS